VKKGIQIKTLDPAPGKTPYRAGPQE